MTYVDGFVLTVKKDKIEDYKKLATKAAELWKKHGALSYQECIGDDLQPEGGKYTFLQLTNCSDDEVVLYSFITYRDRAHRDEVNAAVMSDPDMACEPGEEMPFDINKMAWGGFEAVVK